ncbi:cytochrome b/b6 domain-containing protein [Azospirillum sp. ST 5-10]|uniref:cytochrome b/b6 domain-containing protein n=1 Tax=unclassified Azospirillum TaxID=2630922 RepID=UPI003F4A1369
MDRPDTGGPRQILVWDLPTRVFHWLLAGLVAVAFISGKRGAMELHFVVGYLVLTLLLFRVIWGFVGSQTARFADFLKGPAAMLAYVRTLRRRGGPPVLGHNPLGGAMVMALLAFLLLQAVSGLFTTDEILHDGPLVGLAPSSLVGTLSTLHRTAIDVLVVLVALHVAAVLLHLLVKGENLVRPMLTGRKTVPAGGPPAAPRRAPTAAALLALAAAAAVVAAVVNAA